MGMAGVGNRPIIFMLTTIIILIIGLAVLILGGDYLVKGASGIALQLKISPSVVGLTIVAFGTSAPELLISVQSALAGSPNLAMGNVIGSNICNLALVLGLTAVVHPVKVQADSLRIDWPMAMGSSVLLYFMVRQGNLNAAEGLLFITILVAYQFFIIKKSRKNHVPDDALKADSGIPDAPGKQMKKDAVFIMLGCVGLYFGSEWFVGSAKDLAIELGVSERVVGLTVVAIGTSLPELVTSAVASFKGHADLALGNLMGSNIFNILSILGITSLITEIRVSDAILQSDIIWMLAITLMVLPLMFTKSKVERAEGIVLLGVYVIYVYNVVV